MRYYEGKFKITASIVTPHHNMREVLCVTWLRKYNNSVELQEIFHSYTHMHNNNSLIEYTNCLKMKKGPI